jgi:hypothetical protein
LGPRTQSRPAAKPRRLFSAGEKKKKAETRKKEKKKERKKERKRGEWPKRYYCTTLIKSDKKGNKKGNKTAGPLHTV